MLYGVENIKTARMAVLPNAYLISVIIIGNWLAPVKGMNIPNETKTALNISIESDTRELGSNSMPGVTSQTPIIIEKTYRITGMGCDIFVSDKPEYFQDPKAVLNSRHLTLRGRTSVRGKKLTPNEIGMRACVENGILVKLTIPEKGKGSTDVNCTPIGYRNGQIDFGYKVKIIEFKKGWLGNKTDEATTFLETENKLYGGLAILLASTGISEITSDTFEDVPSLRYVDLSDNSFRDTKIVANLSSTIERVVLASNEIAGIEANAFSNLVDLFELDLTNNQITTIDPRAFANNRLSVIRLARNRLSSLPSEVFNGVPALYYLAIDHNLLTTIPANVFNSTRLGVLKLHNNRMTVIGSRTFRHEKLQFESNSSEISRILNDEFETNVKGNEDLRSNDSTDTEYVAYLPLTTVDLVLSFNNITRIDGTSFWNLEKLRSLDLKYNKIMTVEPGAFKNNHQLRTLELEHNHISRLVAGVFTELPYLHFLTLASNEIETIPANAFDLTGLISLNLSHNGITVIEGGAFKGIGKLSLTDLAQRSLEIDISYNPIMELRNDAFFGLENIAKCHVKMVDTPIQIIGGSFLGK